MSDYKSIIHENKIMATDFNSFTSAAARARHIIHSEMEGNYPAKVEVTLASTVPKGDVERIRTYMLTTLYPWDWDFDKKKFEDGVKESRKFDNYVNDNKRMAGNSRGSSSKSAPRKLTEYEEAIARGQESRDGGKSD